MISVVNGYVCTSSCDAASARAGKDPNAPPGTLPGQSGKTDNKADKISGLDGQPATVLDGALKDLAAANTAATANGVASSDANQPAIDRLA